jgi:hypothetical protein
LVLGSEGLRARRDEKPEEVSWGFGFVLMLILRTAGMGSQVSCEMLC